MAKKKPAKQRVTAGNTKEAVAAREVAFAHAYLANGMNGTQAAISAGFSAKGAEVTASRLLRRTKVKAILVEAAKKAAEAGGLTVERTLREVARVAYSDPRKLYDKDGNLIPVHLLDDDTAATVASIEVLEEYAGRGENRELVGYTKKLKHWDKNGALEKAMKYHGLYREDNKQIGESIPMRIVFGRNKT